MYALLHALYLPADRPLHLSRTLASRPRQGALPSDKTRHRGTIGSAAHGPSRMSPNGRWRLRCTTGNPLSTRESRLHRPSSIAKAKGERLSTAEISPLLWELGRKKKVRAPGPLTEKPNVILAIYCARWRTPRHRLRELIVLFAQMIMLWVPALSLVLLVRSRPLPYHRPVFHTDCGSHSFSPVSAGAVAPAERRSR